MREEGCQQRQFLIKKLNHILTRVHTYPIPGVIAGEPCTRCRRKGQKDADHVLLAMNLLQMYLDHARYQFIRLVLFVLLNSITLFKNSFGVKLLKPIPAKTSTHRPR